MTYHINNTLVTKISITWSAIILLADNNFTCITLKNACEIRNVSITRWDNNLLLRMPGEQAQDQLNIPGRLDQREAACKSTCLEVAGLDRRKKAFHARLLLEFQKVIDR